MDALGQPASGGPLVGDRSAPFHLIAHRGGAGHAPENTLAAFAWAVEHGFREVELDVRLSRDGELVLFHDERLDGKTTLSGPVADHAASDLLATDIGRWFDAEHPQGPQHFVGTCLTSLPRVLETFGESLDYHVELKGGEAELPERVVAELRARAPECTRVISAFSFDDLVRTRECDPAARVCWLLRDAPGWLCALPAARRDEQVESQCQRIDRAAEAGFAMIGVRAAALCHEGVEHARRRQLELRAWGVGSDAEFEHVLAVGAAGATLDWPLAARARLRAHGIEIAAGVLT